MHPSSNIINGCKPPKSSSFFGTYYNDITTHSRTPQDHYYTTPSSFSFPSPNYINPLEDEAVFCDSFQHQQYFSNDTIILAHDMTTNVESIMGESGSNNINGAVQVATNIDGDDEPYDFISTHMREPDHQKRHSKGDRHSKIDTARGPRDRRMRLSLDVAKKLFGLQDLLGFDKASKTVDWLLTKSRSAILELLPDRSCSFMGVSNSASSTSECEVLSGTTTTDNIKVAKSATSGNSNKQKEKTINRGVRRGHVDLHHPLAKATRERARARARERTIEKRNCNSIKQLGVSVIGQDLGSWSHVFEENQCQISADQMSSQFQFKQGFAGDNSTPMMMTTAGNWSPPYFNYQHITHEHHLNEFQVIGKSWEGNNA